MGVQRLILAVGVLALGAVPAWGQTLWVPTTGGTFAWNTPANWNPATVPNAANASASVTANITGDQTITLDSLIDLNTLTIGDAGSSPFNAYTITPGTGGSFRFNGAGATISSSNSANTISAPIALLAGLTVTHTTGAGSLTLSGGVDTGTGAGAQTLTVAATNSSFGALTSGVVISGPITGDGGLTKMNGGFLNLTAANTYTGVTTISGGAIRLSGSGTIGTGNLTLAGGQFFPGAGFTLPLGTGNGQVQWTGTSGFGTIGQDLTVNLGGAGAGVTWAAGSCVPSGSSLLLSSTSSDGLITFVNPIDLNGGARTIQVDNGAQGIDVTMPGALSNSTLGLTKAGNGVLELTGANTFSGGVTITGGGLRVNSDSANSTDAAPLGLAPAAPAVNITLNGGNLIFGTAFTLNPNRQISISSGANNGIDTNGLAITLSNTTITGAGGFAKAGAGTLTLNPSGTYTYAGATSVNNGTLAIGGTNVLPTGTTLNLGSGTSVGNLDLGTFDQTVGGLLARSDNAAANTVTIAAGRTLTVSNANAPANAGTATEVPFVLLNNGNNSSANAQTSVTFTGGGSLVVNTPQGILHAGQAGGIPGFGDNGTVDMSGLASLTATVTELRVGDFGNGATNPGGATVFTLAQSNTITASRSISVGASGRTSGLGPVGFQVNTLRLGGGTNLFNANNVYIGSNVRNAANDSTSSINLITSPRSDGAILFAGPTGTFTLRGSDGSSRSNLFLGTVSTGTATPRANTFDVTGHTANLLLDQLVVSAPGNYSGTGGPLDSVFSFDTGTLDVNTIVVARQAGSTATVGLANMTGTVNIGGGTVTVNTGPITLATVTSGAATGAGTTVTNTGTLNVSGGSVTVLGGGVTLGNNTATNLANLVAAINVSGGTLTVNGAIAPGAVTNRVTSNLNLSGGVLNMKSNDIGNLTNLTFSGGTLQNPGTVNRALTQSGGTLLRDATAPAATTTIAGAYSVTNGTARVNAGVLSVNSAAFNTGSTLAVKITGGASAANQSGGSTDSTTAPTTNGLLRVTGATPPTFDAGAAVVVDITGAGLTQGSPYSYVILTGASPNTNPFTVSQVQIVGSPVTGVDLFTNGSGNVILSFTPVPEPGLVLLAGAGGLLLVRRLRGRRETAPAVAA